MTSCAQMAVLAAQPGKPVVRTYLEATAVVTTSAQPAVAPITRHVVLLAWHVAPMALHVARSGIDARVCKGLNSKTVH